MNLAILGMSGICKWMKNIYCLFVEEGGARRLKSFMKEVLSYDHPNIKSSKRQMGGLAGVVSMYS